MASATGYTAPPPARGPNSANSNWVAQHPVNVTYDPDSAEPHIPGDEAGDRDSSVPQSAVDETEDLDIAMPHPAVDEDHDLASTALKPAVDETDDPGAWPFATIPLAAAVSDLRYVGRCRRAVQLLNFC